MAEDSGSGEESSLSLPWGEKVLYGGISAFLVAFAGLVSGLSLGLMSQDKVDLMVLLRSGTAKEKKYANMIMPVVANTHFTLVTLLLCNAIALEALPIFLRKLIDEVTAIILSVSVVLLFGEIVPQALCVRFGLVIGAYLAWLVRFLRWITFPISYPVSLLLDLVMGKSHSALFKRQQLKALVALHREEEGYGGGLSEDEVKVITGALDMHLKPVHRAMTPLEKVFMLPSNAKLDHKTMETVAEFGHSRIPIHRPDSRTAIVGSLLTKDLIMVNPADALPLESRKVRDISYLPADAPMFDALNLFQVGRSHLAVVVKPNPELLATYTATHSAEAVEQLVPIGIVTLEDIIEELLQEEIVDETDRFMDNMQTSRVDKALLLSQLPPHLKRWLIFSLSAKTGVYERILEERVKDHDDSSHGAGSSVDARAPLLQSSSRSEV